MSRNQTAAESGLLKIDGSTGVQNGIPMLLGFAKAEPLTEAATGRHLRPRQSNTGYQRTAQMHRASARPPTTTTRAVACRTRSCSTSARTTSRKVELGGGRPGGPTTTAIESGGNWIGTGRIVIKYDDGEGLRLRRAAPQRCRRPAGRGEPGGLRRLPGARRPSPWAWTTSEEMKEFYEVNNNAKSVKVDLAWELLRKMAAERPGAGRAPGDQATRTGRPRAPTSPTHSIESGGLWSDKIQRANVKKVRSDNLVLNISQFVRSLQPVLGDARPEEGRGRPGRSRDRRLLGGHRARCCPSRSPRTRRSTSCRRVRAPSPSTASSRRWSRSSALAASASATRTPTPACCRTCRHSQRRGRAARTVAPTIVTGADFWLSGPEGVASQWTGDAGRKRLAVRIQAAASPARATT